MKRSLASLSNNSKKRARMPCVVEPDSLVRTERLFRPAMFEYGDNLQAGPTWVNLLCHEPTAIKTVHLLFMLQVFTSTQPSPSECRLETLPETLQHCIDAVRRIKEQYKLLCIRAAMVHSLKTSLSRTHTDVYTHAVALVLSRPALPPIDELLPLPSSALRTGVYIQLRNCTNPAYSTLQLISKDMPGLFKARLLLGFPIPFERTPHVLPSELHSHFEHLASDMALNIQSNFATQWTHYTRMVDTYFEKEIFNLDPILDNLDQILNQ